VGAGIGALTLEMIKRGTTNAFVVDASSSYLTAASEEATRLLPRASIQFVHGDFVSIADQLPAVDVVTLDRVICCYPLYGPLLTQALRHAERGFAYSYPRDGWYVKVVVWLENVIRSRKSPFRTFVHDETQMKELIEGAGFELTSHDSTLTWSADVFVKHREPRHNRAHYSNPGVTGVVCSRAVSGVDCFAKWAHAAASVVMLRAPGVRRCCW